MHGPLGDEVVCLCANNDWLFTELNAVRATLEEVRIDLARARDQLDKAIDIAGRFQDEYDALGKRTQEELADLRAKLINAHK